MEEDKTLNRFVLFLTDIIIIIFMMLFIFSYIYTTSQKKYDEKIVRFEDMTKSLVQTTKNYLYGSQEIVDSWANYINDNRMTIEEAATFLRSCKGNKSTFGAQVLYVDEKDLTGLSAEADVSDPNNYTLKYGHENFYFYNANEIETGNIHMTRTFTNQRNGVQSVAFYNHIVLKDENGLRDAIVLYVIPLSSFEKNLQIINTTFSQMDYVVTTSSGDYISKNNAFKNTNVFDYLDSYNNYNAKEFRDLKQRVFFTENGEFDAKNAEGKEIHYAYASDPVEKSFIIVSSMSAQREWIDITDMTLLIISAVGLSVLFILNFLVILRSNKRLDLARKEADKANEAKSTFLSTMSHDIRTPLNAILGFTSKAQRDIDDKEEVQEDLKKISSAGDHLLLLINDVLELSRIESKQLQLENYPLNLNDVFDALKDVAEPMADEKHIELNMELKNISEPYVIADRLRINQIFMNIIGNAIKYTNDGGYVHATFEQFKAEKENQVLLKGIIADNGKGMSKDFIPHMFESFSREEDGRTSKVVGTGLGLAIVKQLVDMMEGHIEVESEENKYSIFTIEIPLQISEKIVEEEKEIHEESTLSGMRVLVAEDNLLNWEIIFAMLTNLDAQATHAENGKEALDILEKNPGQFDFVLMDIRMPVMDGFAATKCIRNSENASVKDIPIIALTADAFAENVEACLKAGMDGHIAKPIYEEELIKTVSAIWGKKKR